MTRGAERASRSCQSKAAQRADRGKNFRDFCGKPLFRWMLDTPAFAAGNRVGRDQHRRDGRRSRRSASATGRACGCAIAEPELCGDLVSMNLVLEDDVAAVPAAYYVMTHATNPLLGAANVSRAIAEVSGGTRQRGDRLVVFGQPVSVAVLRPDARPLNHDPDNLVRTQDLEPWFEENSNLYLFTADSFRATRATIGRRPADVRNAPDREPGHR